MEFSTRGEGGPAIFNNFLVEENAGEPPNFQLLLSKQWVFPAYPLNLELKLSKQQVIKGYPPNLELNCQNNKTLKFEQSLSKKGVKKMFTQECGWGGQIVIEDSIK